MDFLREAVPIIRGRCNVCGTSRNLRLAELSGEIPCDHLDRGCTGIYEIVYCGSKAGIPSELENVRCACGIDNSGPDSVLQQLCHMGFPLDAARRAIALCGNDAGAAVNWLTSDEGQEFVSSCSTASVHEGASSAQDPAASSRQGVPSTSCGASKQEGTGSRADVVEVPQDIGECSICCDPLLLADAAMRCLGRNGKKHYFHAQCLAAWVRQCQQSGTETTCPECRGPVQVRPRRLQEFLQDKGHKLARADQEALKQFEAAVSSQDADDEGWSTIQQDLLTAGAIVGLGVGLAFALAAGVRAFSGASSSSSSRDRGRRNG